MLKNIDDINAKYMSYNRLKAYKETLSNNAIVNISKNTKIKFLANDTIGFTKSRMFNRIVTDNDYLTYYIDLLRSVNNCHILKCLRLLKPQTLISTSFPS